MSDSTEIFEQLDQLIVDLPSAQRTEIRQLANEAIEHREALQQALDNCQNSMTDLRLCLKYIAFDREASAREST